MKNKEKIIPEREFCYCGKKVKNHHWLCDKCWGEKTKIKSKIKSYEFTKKISKSKEGKKVLEDNIKKLKKKLKEGDDLDFEIKNGEVRLRKK